MARKLAKNDERRKFIRLDRVFPVEFQFLDRETQNPISKWHQALTDNVSHGGLGLTINDPECEVRDLIDKKPNLSLKIKMPLSGPYVHAKGEFRWLVKEKDDDVEQYIIGISYKEINPQDSRKILRYAYIKKFTPIFVLGIIAILFASISFSFYFNVKLIKHNLGLAHDLFSILHKSRKAKDTIKEIKKQKDDLDLKLSLLSIKTDNLNQKIVDSPSKGKALIDIELNKINTEIGLIKQRMYDLYIKEAQITEDLLSVEKKKPKITDDDIKDIYAWVKTLPDVKNGQIKIPGATTRDSLLASQLCSVFGDYEQANKTLDFYFKNEQNLNNEERLDLIITVLKYSYFSKDNTYLALIKKFLLSFQELEQTKTNSFSLKLYAALDMYLKLSWDDSLNITYRNLAKNFALTSNPEEIYEYLLILNIKKFADIDIASVISKFEDNFSCVRPYNAKDNSSKPIKGFIFSKNKDSLERNFVEDTAKTILMYKLTARFFEIRRDIYRAKFYRDKAFFYINELSNLVEQAGPADKKFLPYIEGAFSNQPSVAASVYTIFAYYNYNPFIMDE